MKKKIIIIAIILVVAIVAYIFLTKSDETTSENVIGAGTQSGTTSEKWDLSTGEWTKTQREKALIKLTDDWFPHIISQNWDCVKEKNAEKLLNDSIYQIWLNVTNHVKSVGKDDSATYLAFPIDVNKGWSDLLENMKINGVYAYALEDAKAKLQ